MKVLSLQSGSNGNCIYVEGSNTRLLLDAGISGKQAQERLAARGVNIETIDGVFISHDHSDHIRCAGVYQRKFGLPIYATPSTIEAANHWRSLGKLADVRHFKPGEEIVLGSLSVRTIPTPHDAVEGVAFVISDGRKSVGVLTDLGHVFDGLQDVLAGLDAVLLESNYDPHMLANGPYPEALQRRIRGPGGHLSNHEAAGLLDVAAGGKLKWACLAHLSEENNTPGLALETHREIVPASLPLHVAGRYEASDWMTV